MKIVDDDRSLVDDLTTDAHEPFTNPTCTSYLLERLGITGRDRLSLFSESTLPLPQDHEMKDYLRTRILLFMVFELKTGFFGDIFLERFSQTYSQKSG